MQINDPDKQQSKSPPETPDIEPLFRMVAESTTSPAQLIELFYFATEPRVMSLYRAIGRMDEHDRGLLEEFLITNGNERIDCKAERGGTVRLMPASRRIRKSIGIAVAPLALWFSNRSQDFAALPMI